MSDLIQHQGVIVGTVERGAEVELGRLVGDTINLGRLSKYLLIELSLHLRCHFTFRSTLG